MSDEPPVHDSAFLAKQRLASDVKILVNVQIAALVVASLSCIFPPAALVVISVIGVSVFFGAAVVNFYKLAQARSRSLPVWMWIYSRWGIIYLFLCVSCMQAASFIHVLALERVYLCSGAFWEK